ncbi:MAG: hypothetical protein ONB48_20945 [candidate division KSB1 bacterium]|nr:hypothetical protein [candidate division KSB1 bacterium]MDZ7276447.1 hypothetical protein [candidate division KSB1 bacterium]MDZ7288116.1 hypothetical protein [candidate division KSB1 bacterium]MDZ7300217.1 hypothetical protein [candidate division KSB1 bacterium]MDZ7305788.1 hypothetical protein [candidate division KSB1 bacterium]
MEAKKFLRLLFPAVAALTLAACSNEDPLSSSASLSATEDAAESIASALGADNGGATDQVSDVIELAGSSGLQKPAEVLLGKYSVPGAVASVDTSYDPLTGTWTLHLERERGNPNGVPYAAISRTYTYQFLNPNGQPQKYWKTGADTARTIIFKIIEGTGTHRTRRLSQQLTGLTGEFTATGVNTRLVTINGTYFRSAVDTITTRNAVRTLDHALRLTFTNVQGPRGSRLDLSRKISGTVSGTYTARVTFQRGAGYRETTINRTFTVVLGNGRADITIGGQRFAGNLTSGELQ